MYKNLTTHNLNQGNEPARNGGRKFSRKSRLLIRVLVVSLLLVAAVAPPSVSAFARQREARKARDHRTEKMETRDHRTGTVETRDHKTEKIDPEEHLAADLIPMLKNQQLREGLNLMHTGPKGLKLSAQVKGGKITDWLVTDKGGKIVPSAYYRVANRATCYKCISPLGARICWRIPCPRTGPIIIIVLT
jgi:hypothetical protein